MGIWIEDHDDVNSVRRNRKTDSFVYIRAVFKNSTGISRVASAGIPGYGMEGICLDRVVRQVIQCKVRRICKRLFLVSHRPGSIE